jgi:alpha-tubulin suppressor-like RCC1 family protein
MEEDLAIKPSGGRLTKFMKEFLKSVGDNTPEHIRGSSNVQVSSVFNHNLILDSHGGVLSFGCNNSGQLGHSGPEEQSFPKTIPTLVDIVGGVIIWR